MSRLATLIVIMLMIAIAALAGVFGYLGLRYRQSDAETTSTYQNATVPIKFKYPSNWVVRSSQQTDGSGTTYYLNFTSGTKDESASPRHASMAIERWINPANDSLSQVAPVDLDDSQHLLKFGPCSFSNTNAVECLEITDQTAWVAAGYLPVQTSTFFRVNGAVYAVAWGQTDNFNFQATEGQNILRTMNFNTGSQP